MNNQIYFPIVDLHSKKIAFIDIDSTLSSHIEATNVQQLLDHGLTNKARKLLEEKGYIVAFITSRTEEMLMSTEGYNLSVKNYKFERPPSRFNEENTPPGTLDPNIIASSTGGKIFVRQKDGGYAEDVSYRRSSLSPFEWRTKTMNLLIKLNTNKTLFVFSSIEHIEDFHSGSSQVFPPDYRIQIQFRNPIDLTCFKKMFKKYGPELYAINDSWPQEKKYYLYISASRGKFEAVNRILDMMQPNFNMQSDLEILFVGDSLPDLYEAVFSTGKLSTLLLVGGSRLSSYISNKSMNDFAGDDLGNIKKYLLKQAKGIYTYQVDNRVCNIIVSDEKYPGLVGPESLIEYLS